MPTSIASDIKKTQEAINKISFKNKPILEMDEFIGIFENDQKINQMTKLLYSSLPEKYAMFQSAKVKRILLS